jgi:hypothetical protein
MTPVSRRVGGVMHEKGGGGGVHDQDRLGLDQFHKWFLRLFFSGSGPGMRLSVIIG